MRSAYIETLQELAAADKNVLALISDNGAIVYDKFRASFPAQYFNFGISEANMVAAAAGLASCGKIPFVYTIGAFLAYRACEFIRNDVCLQKQNVKIVGTGAGLSYSTLGPTHHTTEDIAILTSMPNLTVFSPASPLEVKKVVRAAYEINAPVYIRLGTNKEPEVYERDYDFKVGKLQLLRKGTDIAFISTGSILSRVIEAAERLGEQGTSCAVWNAHTLKPFDVDGVREIAKNVKLIVTVEEHSVNGLGALVAQAGGQAPTGQVPVTNMGLDNSFAVGYGTHDELRAENGLSVEEIISVAMSQIS